MAKLATWPILAAPYRPFFLLAALAAAIIPPVSVVLIGESGLIAGLPAALWHAHELTFGVMGAVIAGFVLTAGARWTGQPSLAPAGVAALAGTWLLARIALALAAVPSAIAAVLDGVLLLGVAVWLARALLRSGNRRNLWVLGVLALLIAANAAMHCGFLAGAWPLARAGAYGGMGLVAAMIALIGGRIVPNFTRNAVPAAAPRSYRPVEAAAVPLALGVAVLLAAQPLLPTGLVTPLLMAVASAAAATHLVRVSGWGGLACRHEPLLWSLHLGYAWLVAGYTFVAASAAGLIALPAALHGLGVGAMGTMILAMMARVPLGHTGRPLVAPAVLAPALLAISGAAAIRLGVAVRPELFGDRVSALSLAAGLWSLAFLLYLGQYATILWPSGSARAR